MKLSLGIGQTGDETFLAPSGPVSHYSHHSQSPTVPTDTVMRKMKHGGRRSQKYYQRPYWEQPFVPFTHTSLIQGLCPVLSFPFP